MNKRLSICYAAPGHAMVSTSGTTRNILSLAGALANWADVTVAFRSLPKQDMDALPPNVKLVAIDPRASGVSNGIDDEATRGVNPLTHLTYFRTVRSFARRHSGLYNLVFEKGWRVSGYLLHAFQATGTRGAVIENDARCWTEERRDLRTWLKYGLHRTAQALAGYYSRRAPVVIAETEELRDQLIRIRGIEPGRIKVVPLGVDQELFRPADQMEARLRLGIHPDRTILLYVGGMDKYHDLSPVLEALVKVSPENVELHVVGDGEFGARYLDIASRVTTAVVFHGRVPHSSVPIYIAASDLCLAPYCQEAFFDGIITFSTLKIPEYMSCARPVASIPSGEISRLIQPEASGFLFPNTAPAWTGFLSTLPDRALLASMGHTARRSVLGRSWEKTALAYLGACRSLILDGEAGGGGTASSQAPNSLEIRH